MLLTTYVNDLARDALTNGVSLMPAGAIIVKENYMPDSTLAAVTAMHKVSDYDPAHNDWYWAKWDSRWCGRSCRACRDVRRLPRRERDRRLPDDGSAPAMTNPNRDHPRL